MTQAFQCPSSQSLINFTPWRGIAKSETLQWNRLLHLNSLTYFGSFTNLSAADLFSVSGDQGELLGALVFFILSHCFGSHWEIISPKIPEGKSYLQWDVTKFWSSYLLLLLASVAQGAMLKKQGEDLGRPTKYTLCQNRRKFEEVSLKKASCCFLPSWRLNRTMLTARSARSEQPYSH